jgi:hypothetical protein
VRHCRCDWHDLKILKRGTSLFLNTHALIGKPVITTELLSPATSSKKVFIKTFGCQMNEYDSDKMVDVMHGAEGYTKTDNVDEADLILFNTCASSISKPRAYKLA